MDFKELPAAGDPELFELIQQHNVISKSQGFRKDGDEMGKVSPEDTMASCSFHRLRNRRKSKAEICVHQSELASVKDADDLKGKDMETKDSGVPELDEELRERLDWEQQLMAFETELLARESSVFERESAGLLHAKVLQRSIKSKRLLELEKEVVCAEAKNLSSHEAALLAYQAQLDRQAHITQKLSESEENLVDLEALRKAIVEHKAELENSHVQNQKEEHRLRELRAILRQKEQELEKGQNRLDEELERLLQKRKHLATVDKKLGQRERIQQEKARMLLEKSQHAMDQVKLLSEQKAELDRRDLLISDVESRQAAKEEELKERELRLQRREREFTRKQEELQVQQDNISSDIRLLETQRKYLQIQKSSS